MYRFASCIGLALLLASCAPGALPTMQDVSMKLYVAIEGESRITVINPETQEILKSVDLSERTDNVLHAFSPHNVQVAPDGKAVWVTANHGQQQHDEDDGGHGEEKVHDAASVNAPDQVIVIDPRTDTITRRIPIAPGTHLAHIVATRDGAFAYATAQEKGVIYKIDARNFTIAQEIIAPTGSGPHGLRLSPDGATAYIALLQGKGLGILDIATGTLTTIPLGGNAVQTGLTPDGKLVVVSLYDTKRLAVFDVATKNVSYIDLPGDAKGPIQLYPTPDSRYIYVADQGYYFGQPAGNRLFKIDLATKSVIKEIPAGNAPHGVVVSPDGKFVYVTNLLSQDLSIIDTAGDTEVGRIEVGEMPNGISLWSPSSDITP